MEKDSIERLIVEIRNDQRMRNLRPRDDRSGKFLPFSGKFLDSVGKIFETHGFGTTERFLDDKKDKKRGDEAGAGALLCVLEKFRTCKEIINHRAIGRYVIKTLNSILKQGGTPC